MSALVGQRLLTGSLASTRLLTARQPRSKLAVLAERSDDGKNRPRSSKGKSYDNNKRRKGRPAHLRTPYDSPLRDGNRDRLIGLLTERSVKTLLCYLMETNLNVYHWLLAFLKENPIPRNGNWDDVSGETFLRKLLSMPIEEAKFETGRDPMFDNIVSCGVDPRSIAQRIMDIRAQLSKEFIQDLSNMEEENAILLRETIHNSFISSADLDTPSTTTPVTPAIPPTPTASATVANPADPSAPTPAAPADPPTPTPAPPAAPAEDELPLTTIMPDSLPAFPTAASAATPPTPTPTPAAAVTVLGITTRLPPEIEALIKAAYPDGKTPENMHPEILELLQQAQALPTPAEAAPAADAAAPASAAPASQDLVGTLEGSPASPTGSADDLVITNVTGQQVVLGPGEQGGADKVTAVTGESTAAEGQATGDADADQPSS